VTAVALVLLAVLNVADVWSTDRALAAGAGEDNPVAASLIESGRLALVKAALVLLVVLLVRRCGRRWASAAVWAVAGMYAVAVVGNVAGG
jgi:hypothetical protein